MRWPEVCLAIEETLLIVFCSSFHDTKLCLCESFGSPRLCMLDYEMHCICYVFYVYFSPPIAWNISNMLGKELGYMLVGFLFACGIPEHSKIKFVITYIKDR